MDFLDRIRTRAAQRARGDYGAYEHVRRGMCFVQGDQSIANQAGAAFRSDLNTELQALVTNSQAATAPATTYRNQYWHDTTANVIKRRNAANAAWLVVDTLDETYVLSRSSNTILGLSDVTKTIVATSSFTQTLTAAATLGDRWWVMYRNDGTGVITLDPNGAETIDGAATLKIYPGEGLLIVCNGTSFKTIGLRGAAAKVVTFTRDTSVASGNQAVTGVGFKPRAVILLMGLAGNAVASVGMSDGAASYCIYDDAAATPTAWGPSTIYAAFVSGGGANYGGSIGSLDDDGFTVAWVRTGAPTAVITLFALCLR